MNPQLRWGYSLLVPVYAARDCNFHCDFHDIENNIPFFFFSFVCSSCKDFQEVDFQIDKVSFSSIKKNGLRNV